MQTPSPHPRTPTSSYSTTRYLPQFSSPLADACARRRSQYKSRTPRRSCSTSTSTGATALPGPGTVLSRRSVSTETPHNEFLRERFQARCIERARKKRELAIVGRRWGGIGSEGSSDGLEDAMDCDENEEEELESDDLIMQDEFFRRIVDNAKRKKRHVYRLSYAYEVGSSFDPDMEDVGQWENELHETGYPSTCPAEFPPDDLDSEELATYAEEYAAIADFADLDTLTDELFDWSDVEDGPECNSRPRSKEKGETLPTDDVNMSG